MNMNGQLKVGCRNQLPTRVDFGGGNNQAFKRRLVCMIWRGYMSQTYQGKGNIYEEAARVESKPGQERCIASIAMHRTIFTHLPVVYLPSNHPVSVLPPASTLLHPSIASLYLMGYLPCLPLRHHPRPLPRHLLPPDPMKDESTVQAVSWALPQAQGYLLVLHLRTVVGEAQAQAV